MQKEIMKDFKKQHKKDVEVNLDLLTLEELTEETCKYMDHDVHPNQPNAKFCGRKTVSNSKQKFSYCPLHLMVIFQPKGKKEDVVDKDDEVPQFIEKKIKSA